MPDILSWENKAKEFLHKVEVKQKLRDNSNKCYRKSEYIDLPSLKKLECSGRQRLARFERAANYLFLKCGIQLGHKQELLFEAIRTAYLLNMFGEDLVSNISFLQKKYNLKELFDAVAILFPRREGKTSGTAILSGIIAVTQPGGNIICYNLSQRQADIWMDHVIPILEFFKDSEEFGWTLLQKNGKEKFQIHAKATGTVNTIYAYPCGLGDGTIGHGCIIVVCLIVLWGVVGW